MSDAIRLAPRYTVEDYRQWPGDWELWEGIAIAMTPSPFGPHQAVVFALVAELRAALQKQACEATALGELDWIISNETVVRPDVIVVCGGPPERHLENPPALVAEILSPSTRRNDLTYKRRLYASQGVGTYLIVDPELRTIELLRLAAGGEYASSDASTPLAITVCNDCTVEIDPARVF